MEESGVVVVRLDPSIAISSGQGQNSIEMGHSERMNGCEDEKGELCKPTYCSRPGNLFDVGRVVDEIERKSTDPTGEWKKYQQLLIILISAASQIIFSPSKGFFGKVKLFHARNFISRTRERKKVKISEINTN